MTDKISDYQKGFEAGLLIGLRTAQVIVRDEGARRNPSIARILDVLGKHIADMKEVQAFRQGKVIPKATAADFFLPSPLAHPADLGMPVDELAEKLVELSQMVPPDAPRRRRLAKAEAAQ